MKIVLVRRYRLSIIHRIDLDVDKHGRPTTHGHDIEVSVGVSKDVSIEALDRIFYDEVRPKYDRKHMNSFLNPPTGEIISKALFQDFQHHLKDEQLHWIKLQETRKNSFKVMSKQTV